MEVFAQSNEERTLTDLWHTHCCTIQQEHLHVIADFVQPLYNLLCIDFGIAFDKSADILQLTNFRFQFLDGVAIYENEVIKSLQLLTFGKLLFLAPRIITTASR